MSLQLKRGTSSRSLSSTESRDKRKNEPSDSSSVPSLLWQDKHKPMDEKSCVVHHSKVISCQDIDDHSIVVDVDII